MELARTTPEQRSAIYNDVRHMLSPGFLAHPIVIQDQRLAMRSLDASDWQMLRFRAAGMEDHEWKGWAVATSVWMVNGMVVLDSEESMPLVAEMCLSLPRPVLNDMYGVLAALMRRVRESSRRVEGFLYEEESRSLWRSDGPNFVAAQARRGVLHEPNAILRLWAYYNQAEDMREEQDYLWTLAKFQASPHAPKGVKKLTARDQQQARDITARRQRVMDRIYYEATGQIERDGDRGKRAAKRKFQDVIMAETPEELREEMRRWVAGEKDEHDRIVDGVKAKIRTEVEGRRREQEERRRALQKALEDEGIKSSRLVPLTGKAGQEFIERVKAKVPGVSKVMDDRTHNSAYEKYIAKPADSGALQIGDDGVVHEGTLTDPKMLEMMRAPSPEDPGSLQDQIEQRTPTVTFVDDTEEEN